MSVDVMSVESARDAGARRLLHGPELLAGGAQFVLWAPGCGRVRIETEGSGELLPMERLPDGWHQAFSSGARAGTRYRFVLPDGMRVPDPASRYQPDDVHGPSEIVDLSSWVWHDEDWTGRPWEEAVLYEMHIGTFTPEGTFRAAISRLDHLAALGVTAIEIMPVADFPGRRSWGYDGVLWYAPDSSYGRPEDLKALVEAAHARGLMVLLDVVYNHFGPDGNYLPVYAPQIITDRHKTPWGDAINFDGPGSKAVRELVIQNAIYWVKDFHMDGLRLDAVHAIADDSPVHILTELAERVRAASGNRRVHLVLENEENESRPLERDASRHAVYYTAQWNDDVHHVLHTAVTAEDKGYYAEYSGDTHKLGRALAEGFAFQGEMMLYRGKPRGETSTRLPPSAFVTFLQNHDQIGNRAFGERLGAVASTQALRAAAAVYLLLPQIPMLFMGEEWNAPQPFPFFCDFGPELAEAVRKGRREEFAKFPEFRDPEQRERIPDPQAFEIFASGKLDWNDLSEPGHRECLEWYRQVLAQRRKFIVPAISRIPHGGWFEIFGDQAVVVRWELQPAGELMMAANLSDRPATGFPPMFQTRIWTEGQIDETSGTLAPWSVVWSMKARGLEG